MMDLRYIYIPSAIALVASEVPIPATQDDHPSQGFDSTIFETDMISV